MPLTGLRVGRVMLVCMPGREDPLHYLASRRGAVVFG